MHQDFESGRFSTWHWIQIILHDQQRFQKSMWRSRAIQIFRIKCILEILPVLRPWAIKPHPDRKATLKVQLQSLLQKFQYKMHWKGQRQMMLYKIVESKWFFSHQSLPKWAGCILVGIGHKKNSDYICTNNTCTNAPISAIQGNFNETNCR